MPMLAKPYKLGSLAPETLVWLQPKLDGHRCLAGWVNGEVKLWSRGGKFIDTLPHINESLTKSLPKDRIVDGELYIHGVLLQDLSSIIKNANLARTWGRGVFYHLYDCVSTLPFSERVELLEPLRTEDVTVVPTVMFTATDIERMLARALNRGLEGIMVRLNDDTPYEAGYRSGSLLKVKAFEDREYEVLDIIRSNRGVPLLICDGFSLVAPGTKEEKEAIFNNKDKYINQKVTVKYANLTKDGIPFHPVAIRFREDI
jgi:DNA ligase-1